ncbi:DUF7408 domain-containing protein [Haloglomus halophilum]|uniref:DUF7408 domain-containing protein n=1 Tax=Haloglomus halophilum TaxID=2962672 RepID=UPI0020C99CD0|nr:BatA domain-containing protein [Haloglomus halophilum]
MAGLADVFLTPLGLLALLAVVPILLLYLVRPDPRRLQLPTLEFLAAGEEGGTDSAALETLRRNLLLFLQLLVVVLVALALASPYVTTSGTATVTETVVVLDTSASMAVEDASGGSRFDRARAIARESVSQTTSVVTAGATPRVRLQASGAADAREVLDDLSRTDAAGDLSAAVSQAVAVADEDARIVVVSDFAGAGAWRDAVETARGRGYTVDLRPVGSEATNVGFVDAEYGRTSVTLSVKSYADRPVERTVSLGGARETLRLQPGDVGTATLPVPTGDATARLSPGDGFALDDRVAVSGPGEARIRVLLVSNDPDRYLVTALEVLDEVSLTVAEPPTAVEREYDVVVFAGVDRQRLLQGTREAAGSVTREGGGTIVVAQDDLGQVGYGGLLPVEPTGRSSGPSVRASDDPLVRGISFPPPKSYLTAELRNDSESLVRANDSPLLARGRLGNGRTLYYGYLPGASQFQFNYQYPVLWKRLVYEAAGREPLPRTNYETGTRLSVPNGTAVAAPDGSRTAADGSVSLDAAGHYRLDDRRVAAALLDAAESNVSAPALRTGPDGVARSREEVVQRPLDLSPAVALAALGVLLTEVALLRRRGDL